MKKECTSGYISLVDDVVVYRIAGGGWTVKLSDVRLIGEYTTANGPYIDDYFWVFLTAEEGGWHEASFYAAGRDDFLVAVGKALSTPIETGLCNSTVYRTRVVWPPEVKGQPLMRIVPKPTRLGRLWARINGVQDIVLSDAAKSVFRMESGAEHVSATSMKND